MNLASARSALRKTAFFATGWFAGSTHTRLFEENHFLQRGRTQRQHHQREIERAGPHPQRDVLNRAAGDVQFDVRVLLCILHQDRRQMIQERGRSATERKLPAVRIFDGLGRVFGLLQHPEDVAPVLEQILSSRRQGHVSPVSIEKGNVQGIFQFPHVLAYGRLRDEQPMTGLRETPGLRDRPEDFELAEVDRHGIQYTDH